MSERTKKSRPTSPASHGWRVIRRVYQGERDERYKKANTDGRIPLHAMQLVMAKAKMLPRRGADQRGESVKSEGPKKKGTTLARSLNF